MDVLIFFLALMFLSIVTGHFLWFLGFIIAIAFSSMNVFISDIQRGGQMQYQDLDISMKRFRGGGRLKYSGLVRERAVESTKNNMDAAI